MDTEREEKAIEGLIDEIRHLKMTIAQALEMARETALVLTKLDEAQLWLTRCTLRRPR